MLLIKSGCAASMSSLLIRNDFEGLIFHAILGLVPFCQRGVYLSVNVNDLLGFLSIIACIVSSWLLIYF